MAGRKKKPTHMALVQGNPGKRPINKLEPKPERGIPTCPAHLSKRAKITFRKLGKALHAMGVLTKADGLALELLVTAHDEYRDARDIIHDAAAEKIFEGQTVEMKDGLIYKSFTQNGVILRAHPANALATNAWRRTASMLAEFGLTPASRSKVSMVGDAAEEDPFDAFLRSGKQQA